MCPGRGFVVTLGPAYRGFTAVVVKRDGMAVVALITDLISIFEMWYTHLRA